MTLRVIREPSINGRTHGVLLVDDRFFGFTVEDEIRERAGQPVAAWKVPGQTAIPSGRYPVVLTMSARFGRVLPEVLDVPGFTGIRLHSGNTSDDSSGCLLPGLRRNAAGVLDSRMAMEGLMTYLDAAIGKGERAFLLVENPLSYGG